MKTTEELLVEKINTDVKSLIEAGKAATKAEIKGIEDQLNVLKDKEIISDAMKAELIQAVTDIKSLKEKGATNPMVKKSVEEQLKSFLETNKDKWDAFKKGEVKQFSVDLDIKAAGTMTVAGNTGGSNYLPMVEMVPGWVDLPRVKPCIEDFANSSSTNRSRIVWVEKTNAQGQAEFIGEGELKPLIDFEWKTNRMDAKKVADKIKISTEMLEDVGFMAAAIRGELKYQVDIAVDAGLMDGDGIGDNLKGICAYAGGYVLTSITTENPNNLDAICAAAAQICSLNFTPTDVFISCIDEANMNLAKTAEGVYIIPPFRSPDGNFICGVRVHTCNTIEVGHFVIGDMSKFIVRNYKPFHVAMGWVNDDFELNLVTFIGERRLMSYIADNNVGAFICDEFAVVKAALSIP